MCVPPAEMLQSPCEARTSCQLGPGGLRVGGSVSLPRGTEEEAVDIAPCQGLTSRPCARCSIAGRRRHRWRVPHPVPTTGQAMKTEKDEAVPTFSLGGKYAGEGAGCSEAALPGGPVAGSGGTPAQDLRPLKRRPVPGKHYQCSSYGCKLAFTSMQELMDHLKVHYIPTQSLEGKTFQCPTLGCTETFPSMQDLMAHMKVHYKPNRYFNLPQPPAQHRLRPYVQGHGPPVSNAVWKKSQGVSVSPLLPCFGSGVTPGHSSNSRIVWEHTRGRYTCMQCPYSTASREEMTLHIEDHRKNPPPPGRLDAEMDFGMGIASFHAKLTPEMENSLYSQL
ncbi:zinc finger protein 414 isoform 4-T4 [Spheniscus humboldti]